MHDLTWNIWVYDNILCKWYFLFNFALHRQLLHGNRHGAAERVYRLEFVSNQDFTDTEFHKWKETMMLGGLELPTMEEVERKLDDIKYAYSYKFNELDIEQVKSVICV